MNENFADVDARINGILADGQTLVSIVEKLFAEIDFLYITSTATGVSSAFCPADTIGISANCHCEGDGTTVNFGVLFGCDVGPGGAVGGCLSEAITWNPLLPEPTVSTTAVCVSAILVDGTVASTFPIGAAPPAMLKMAVPEETVEEKSVRYENQLSAIRNARQLKQ